MGIILSGENLLDLWGIGLPVEAIFKFPPKQVKHLIYSDKLTASKIASIQHLETHLRYFLKSTKIFQKNFLMKSLQEILWDFTKEHKVNILIILEFKIFGKLCKTVMKSMNYENKSSDVSKILNEYDQ